MKIRYYHRIDGWRWLGFILAMIGAFILSGGDPSVQWMGWAVAVFSLQFVVDRLEILDLRQKRIEQSVKTV